MPKKRNKKKTDLELVANMTPEQINLVTKLVHAGEQKKTVISWAPVMCSGLLHVIVEWFKTTF